MKRVWWIRRGVMAVAWASRLGDDARQTRNPPFGSQRIHALPTQQPQCWKLLAKQAPPRYGGCSRRHSYHLWR